MRISAVTITPVASAGPPHEFRCPDGPASGTGRPGRNQIRSPRWPNRLEILRIREDARSRLGPVFSLPSFHAAVLDHGSLPMPALVRSIANWVDRSAGQ